MMLRGADEWCSVRDGGVMLNRARMLKSFQGNASRRAG